MPFIAEGFVFLSCWTSVFGWNWRPLGVTSLKTPFVTPMKIDFEDMSKSIIMRTVDNNIPDVFVRTNGSAKIVYWVMQPMQGSKYEVCVNHCPRNQQDDLATIWKNDVMEMNMVRAQGFQSFGTFTYNLIINPEMHSIRVRALDWAGNAHTTVTWYDEDEGTMLPSIKYIGIETIYGTTAFKINGEVDVMSVDSTSAETTTPDNGSEK